jgi:monoamine oxidase
MTELYDHCNREVSAYALCGFLHSQYRSLPPAERKYRVIQQLVSSFGDEASEFLEYNELDWSTEAQTSGTLSHPLFPHQNNGNEIYQHALFDDRLFFAGTETSPHHGGYMEGAVYNAMQVFAKILRTVKQ